MQRDFDEQFREFVKHLDNYYSSGTWSGFAIGNSGLIKSRNIDLIMHTFADSGVSKQTSLFREELVYISQSFVFDRIKDFSEVKILSLPCADGKEVYTLAALCFDNDLDNFSIEGRDHSYECISKAENGEYLIDRKKIQEISDFIQKGYFSVTNSKFPEPNLKVSPKLKNKSEFYVQDILREPLSDSYDLVFCLNFLSYLNQKGRETALENICLNLDPGSILILDSAYQLPPGRLTGRQKEIFGWREELNDFIAGLEENKFNLRQIKEPNIYEKI